MKIRPEKEKDYFEVVNMVRNSFWNNSRFGFVCASKYGYYLNGTDCSEENPFFMIKVFDTDKISSENGIFHNPDVFDVCESDVDEFDEKFEFKEKLIQKGNWVFE